MTQQERMSGNEETICELSDLVPYSGVAALVDGEQVALFYLPDESPCLYAIDNWDPIGQANVLSRGIVGDVEGELVVASPLYKQHFSLVTGECVETEDRVKVWPVRLEGESVIVEVPALAQKISA